jgi:hypothetical protein
MAEPAAGRKVASKVERVFNTVLGLLLVAVAVWILVVTSPSPSIGAVIASLVAGGLGVDGLVSAIRSRPSLLSRLGPMP